MAKYQGSAKAVLGMIIGLVLTVVGWFMISAVGDFMPIALMSVMYWIGFVLVWSLAIIVNPIMIITKGRGSFKDSGKGIMFFFMGSFGALLVYYVIPPIIEALTLSSTITGISWFFIVIFWVCCFIVLPAYQVSKSHLGGA